MSTETLLWVWGKGNSGQLGNGNNQDLSTPVSLRSFSKVFASGGSCSFGIDASGMIWAWGSNTNGRLGVGDINNRSIPTAIARSASYVAISGNQTHQLAIDGSDGSVWAWGGNLTGGLGDSSIINKSSPVSIARPGSYIAISVGYQYSLALEHTGVVWAWGYNQYGQLGIGSTANMSSPVSIARAGSYSKICAGNYLTLLLDGADGSIWSCGKNQYGQLGNNLSGGTLSDCRSIPVSIARQGSYIDISGTDYHALAIDSNGMIWAWGYNGYGQLGNGEADPDPDTATANRSSPVSILRLGSYISISACGGNYSLAVDSNGIVYAWGWNTSGNLGQGDKINRSSPISVNLPNPIFYVSGGFRTSLALEAPPAPVADFTADVTSGTPPLTVNFTDTSTNTPTSWSWSFGDTGSSTDQNPQHIYTTAGTYTVALTATNAGGSDTETKIAYITVTTPSGTPPTKDRDNRSPNNTFGMGGTFGDTVYPILKDDQSGGGGDSGDVLNKNKIRLLGIILKDEQSGSSNGDKVDNSAGVNHGSKFFNLRVSLE